MPHAWWHSVIGGVAVPRFILCDADQFIENSSFDVDTTGWSSGSRVADPLTPFGDYVLQITAASEATCDYGSAIGGKTFVVTLFARGTLSSEDIEVYATAESHTGTLSGLPNGQYKQYSFVVTFAGGQADTDFHVKFDPTGTLYIDRVECYEVTDDITGMPLPNEERYDFPRELQATTIRADRRITEYVMGWRFVGRMNYKLLTATQEIWRAKISEADLLILYPHTDCSFCVTCRWGKRTYRRGYFFNRYMGHVGEIALVGVDLIDKKPQVLSGS